MATLVALKSLAGITVVVNVDNIAWMESRVGNTTLIAFLGVQELLGSHFTKSGLTVAGTPEQVAAQIQASIKAREGT